MDEYIPQLTLTPDLNAQPQPEVKKEEDLITKAQAAPEAGPDLSALSAQEQQAVLAFSKQIDLENAQQILEYGASAQKNIADFSDTALAKVKTGDLGEIGTMLSGLLVELKTMDEPEKKGIAGLFRKAKINAEEMKSRFATAEVNVDRISGELEKHKVTLLKDVAVMDQMYERNLQYFKELTMYILAGKQKLAEARNTTLRQLREKAVKKNRILLLSKEHSTRTSFISSSCWAIFFWQTAKASFSLSRASCRLRRSFSVAKRSTRRRGSTTWWSSTGWLPSVHVTYSAPWAVSTITSWPASMCSCPGLK